MADNQVEIVFKTTAELQGAIAAQNELEKTRGKLLALGKDTVEVDAQLARANALISQAPAGMVDAAKMESQAEAFGHLELKGREFHRVLHEITATSPAAGVALRAFINPATAGFALAVIGLKAFSDSWKEFQEALKLGGKWEDFSKVIAAQSKAFDDAVLSADAFARKLAQVETAENKLKTATEEQIDLIQQRARLQDAERSADLAEKKAEIDAKRKAGVLTEVEALKAQNDLETQFAREKIARENEAARAVIAAHQQQRAETRALIPGVEREAGAADRALILAETPGARASKIERLRANQTAAEAEQKATQQAAESVFGGAADEKRAQNAAQVLATTKAALQAAIAGQFEVEQNYKLLQEATERTRARLEQLNAIDRQLGEKIQRGNYLQIGEERSRATVEATQERTRMAGLVGEIAPQFAKNLAGVAPSPFSGTREGGGGEPSAAQRAAFQQMGISMSDAMVPLILQATKDAVEAAKRRTEQLLSVGKATQN